MDKVINLFLNHIHQTTTSANAYRSYLQTLQTEMIEVGISDVTLTPNGHLMGWIPSNMKREVPTVGFIAYMDDHTEESHSTSVLLTENYSGNDIVVDKTTIFSPDEFPQLKEHIEDTLITSDCHQSLCSLNKAGIVEILSALKKILTDPTLSHGRIAICFIPYSIAKTNIESIDLKLFGAKFAYNMQGGPIGEIQNENFNKATVKIIFKGSQMIVKDTKGKFINAINVAKEFIDEIPEKETQEKSVRYEGYYNISSIQGDALTTEVTIEICDFDKERFEWRKSRIQNGVYEYTKKYELPIEFTFVDEYYNMKDKLEQVGYVTEIAKRAIESVGVKPLHKPFRDVTESAKLVYLGLPTINLCTGVCNPSSHYEFIPSRSLQKATEMLIKIIELSAQI